MKVLLVCGMAAAMVGKVAGKEVKLAGPQMSNGDRNEPYDVFYAQITADGESRDWRHTKGVSAFKHMEFQSNAGVTTIFEENQGRSGTWAGKEDQSSAFRFAWDYKAFHVFAAVVDDEHQHNGGGDSNFVWDGDSLQIMVTNADRTETIGLYNVALYEPGVLRVLPGQGDEPRQKYEYQYEKIPKGCEMHHHQENRVHNNHNIMAHITRIEERKVTMYELSIPAMLLGHDRLKPGIEFGLAIAANDGDLAPAEQGQSGWSGMYPDAIVFAKEPQKAKALRLAPERRKKSEL